MWLNLVTVDVDWVLYNRLFQTVGTLTLKTFAKKDSLTVVSIKTSLSAVRSSLTGNDARLKTPPNTLERVLYVISANLYLTRCQIGSQCSNLRNSVALTSRVPDKQLWPSILSDLQTVWVVRSRSIQQTVAVVVFGSSQVQCSSWTLHYCMSYLLFIHSVSIYACRDTAGQERFRTITTAYYRGAMASSNLFFIRVVLFRTI